MADDEVFQDAVEALREGNKAKARELFTGLLKTDQNNATYWVWMSATMDTAKERVYCLQTAIKLDPENAYAKRGLILHGAMPPDESVKPFPVNRPRAWEQKLLLAHEKPKPKGWAAVRQSPFFRLGIIILLIGGLVSGITFGFIIPRINNVQRLPTITPGPSPTFTLTPTPLGGKPQATSILGVGTQASIAELLSEPYTPTPLYVDVERKPETSDYILQFQNAIKAEKWEDAIRALDNIIQNDPNALYAYYYLGEAYRFDNQFGNAQDAYNRGIQQNQNFGPFYVGLARVRLTDNPNADVLSLLDTAIQLDPNFGEAYIERGRVKIRDNDLAGAVSDLGEANNRIPNSPLVFHYLAQARYKEGSFDQALVAAQRAEQLDVTLLPNYLLISQIQHALGHDDEAIASIQTFIKYSPQDVPATLFLGRIVFDQGRYDQAIQVMDRVISLERTRQEAYLYRFLSYVELGNGEAADNDLDAVSNFYPDLFEANLGVVRTHILQERYGSAELALDKTEELAETDQQKALFYYWAGIVFEKREDPEKAVEYWQLLLDLPEDATTAEIRAEAEEHLKANVKPTATPKTSKSATPTKTRTPTPTKSGNTTPTPSRTPTATPTP